MEPATGGGKTAARQRGRPWSTRAKFAAALAGGYCLYVGWGIYTAWPLQPFNNVVLLFLAVLEGEKTNPLIAEPAARIERQAVPGLAADALIALITAEGWEVRREPAEVAQRSLSQKWLHVFPPDSMPRLDSYSEAIVASPPAGVSPGWFKSGFPCSYRLILYLLLDAEGQMLRSVQARHPTCV